MKTNDLTNLYNFLETIGTTYYRQAPEGERQPFMIIYQPISERPIQQLKDSDLQTRVQIDFYSEEQDLLDDKISDFLARVEEELPNLIIDTLQTNTPYDSNVLRVTMDIFL